MGMSRIFWDTNLFIYLFEDYGEWSKQVAELRQRMLSRNDQLFTSTLTLAEVLVKPTERGDQELRRSYEDSIAKTSVLLPFDREAARIYAEVRRDRSLKAPDAIQLACAAHAEVDLFITNDERLRGKTIQGIQFIVPLRRAYL
jgi:predicted nucleic acid-binding protein